MSGWLGRARVQQLVREVVHKEKTFVCHETLGKNEQQCVGAVIFTEHLGKPHRMFQIAERLGIFTPDRIDRDAAEIFPTADAMEAHHAWE